MKKLFSLLVAGAVLAFGVVGCSPATTAPSSTSKPNATGDAKDKETKGTFEKFDKDKLTIKVADTSKEFDVKGIKPMVDGKEAKFEDIKEKAAVTVTEKDGKVTKVEAKNP